MLLVLTLALVVVAVIELVVGLLDSSLVPIYVSMGSSALAVVVLLLANKISKARVRRAALAASSEGPPPLPPTEPIPAAASLSEPQAGAAPEVAPAVCEPPPPPPPPPQAPPPPPQAPPAPAPQPQAGPEAVFPIADYDRLKAVQVIALLGVLDADELALVRQRELAGHGRRTVLARIDGLLEKLGQAG
ncbi:MAG: hypothetical protein ACYDH5_06000 [Acidimicrobiales bacterium]